MSIIPSNIFHNMHGFENWGISLDIPQLLLGNIQSRDAFRPIACEQKYLMDYNRPYSYSRYWTGTSLEWRLMRGNKCHLHLKRLPALASVAS